MRVLISGAGVAGPTLAWFLARTGARITIVEKTASPLPHGQNVDLQGSAISVVTKMGLLDKVRGANTTEMGTQLIGPNGKPCACFPVREGSSLSATSEFEILRGDLAKILYEASKDHPNVKYLFSTTIKNIVSNDDKSVKVELNNGETQEFDLLVAADGQWSKLRKQVFAPEDVKVEYKGMHVVYYTIPRTSSDNNWWNVYHALGSRIITLRPDPYGTIRAMFTIMPCNDTHDKAWREASRSDRKTQQEFLRREFADAGWQAQRLLDAMDQAPDWYFHVMEQVKMSKWSVNRVVCLGDTAQAPTPLTGMGTSLALSGAYVLAGELSKLKDGENPAKALEAYYSTFHPFVVEMQKIPSIFPGVMHPTKAWKRWMLQSAIWTISKIVAVPFVRNMSGNHTWDDQGFPLPQYPTLDERISK